MNSLTAEELQSHSDKTHALGAISVVSSGVFLVLSGIQVRDSSTINAGVSLLAGVGSAITGANFFREGGRASAVQEMLNHTNSAESQK